MFSIEVNNISKEYFLNDAKGEDTLRDLIVNNFGFGRKNNNKLIALNDVTFKIKTGETIGIIGKNGAGKSTLLKILSRVTPPTSGYIKINGKITSLLEVGTGFHHELTGMENIYLSGAILGVPKNEIDKIVDEIVEFSGIKKFIFTPVKKYSSGMYSRLAFSVAVYVQSEILLIDEVLAVGDHEFQNKCIKKIDEINSESDKTIVFVGHNLGMMKKICSKSILMESGRIEMYDKTELVINEYLRREYCSNDHEGGKVKKIEDEVLIISDVKVFQKGRENKNVFNSENFVLKINYFVKKDVLGLRIYFDLIDQDGDIIIRSFHDENTKEKRFLKKGKYKSEALIPGNLLVPKKYKILVKAIINNEKPYISDGFHVSIDVLDSSGQSSHHKNAIKSKILTPIDWNTINV